MTADIDTGTGSPDGVVCALGDWFGGYALYVAAGRTHFTFARSYDIIELADSGTLDPGAHELAVLYALGEGAAPGRMALLVDGNEVDAVAVEGTLPLAVQHGGAGLRIGQDIGFPVSPRYTPPAPFGGTVHQLRIDAPGTAQADPADEVRAALHAD